MKSKKQEGWKQRNIKKEAGSDGGKKLKKCRKTWTERNKQEGQRKQRNKKYKKGRNRKI